MIPSGGDKICLDGEVVGAEALAGDPDVLLRTNYLWQDIHTLAFEPMFLERHIYLARKSLAAIYGCNTTITAREVGDGIKAMLRANRYPAGSCIVRFCLMPDKWFAMPVQQSVYEGFVLWHDRPRAITVEYELPFAGHQCAVSLLCGEVADDYARRCDAGVALRVNRDGILTGAGDLPLVAVKDRAAFITPTDYGVAESVYRDMAVEAARKSGMELYEQPLIASEHYDEMLLFTPLGITSLKSIDGTLLYNTSALKLSLALPGKPQL